MSTAHIWNSKLPVMILSSRVCFSVISTGTPSMILVYFLMTGSEGRERKPHVIYPLTVFIPRRAGEFNQRHALLTTLVFESQL